MTTEDQIVTLFAKANPVPSLDLFDPVEPLDVTHLKDRSERSSVMTDIKIDKRKVKVPRRWPRLVLGLAIPVIAVVVALVILGNRDSGVAAVALPSTGSLDPGTYFIPEGEWTPGRLTFTVPPGWATQDGWIIKDLDGEPTVPFSGGNNTLLVTWFVSHIYAETCNWRGTLVSVGTTVAELASALLAQEGRVASAPTGVMLGGFPATRIELTVPSDLDRATCDGGIIRFWPDPGPNESGGLCCAPAGSTDVVYVVDVDGNTFAVVARHTATSSEQDRAELEDIIESIRIDPPVSSLAPSP